jgi:hypothetical protein
MDIDLLSLSSKGKISLCSNVRMCKFTMTSTTQDILLQSLTILKRNCRFSNYVILAVFLSIKTLEKCHLLKRWHVTFKNEMVTYFSR